MENLNIDQVCGILKDNGIPDDTVMTLKCESSDVNFIITYNNKAIYAGNFINGEALLQLPNEHEDFCILVPQFGIRLKIKKLIKDLEQVIN